MNDRSYIVIEDSGYLKNKVQIQHQERIEARIDISLYLISDVH